MLGELAARLKKLGAASSQGTARPASEALRLLQAGPRCNASGKGCPQGAEVLHDARFEGDPLCCGQGRLAGEREREREGDTYIKFWNDSCVEMSVKKIKNPFVSPSRYACAHHHRPAQEASLACQPLGLPSLTDCNAIGALCDPRNAPHPVVQTLLLLP